MTKVKICGITNLEDALFAAEAGADALGFVFYAKSPRCIAPDRAREIILRLPPFVTKVGVFVNEELDRVTELMAHCSLDYAQLHGDEPPEQVAALALRVIKAVQVRSAADIERLAQYQAVAYLLDTYHPTKPGGTGETWDWELAAAAKQYGPVILAGGLIPENVGEAIERVHPYAVDVSSGVEAAPGIKDPYGGKFVPETLMSALDELEAAYRETQADAAFQEELEGLFRDYAGRPTPLYLAQPLTAHCSGARIYLKREDLAHTGAHKINNTLGQGLLARRMGKHRLIAETGAGQHGVATATVAALLGMECVIYMGTEDMRRQSPNPYAFAGGRGTPCGHRQPHPEGRHQRSHPRLGDQRARYPLPAGVSAGAASLSPDGSRFPSGHRARGSPASLGS